MHKASCQSHVSIATRCVGYIWHNGNALTSAGASVNLAVCWVVQETWLYLPGLSQGIGFHSSDSLEFQSDFKSKDYLFFLQIFQWSTWLGAFFVPSSLPQRLKQTRLPPVCSLLLQQGKENWFSLSCECLPGSDMRQSCSHFNDQSRSHSHFCLQTNKEVWASRRGKMFMDEWAGHWQALLVAVAWAQALLKSSLAQQEKGLGRHVCSFVPALE